MKKLFCLLFLTSLIYAAPPSEIDLVKERAALNSAKADLEEARKKRDMAVAARWKDREASNQERELFNEKYQENKEKLDALMNERARLQEDVRVAREDLAQVKSYQEQARAEFLSLAPTADRLISFEQIIDQGVPFEIPARLESLNKIKKEMELYKDNPLKISENLFALALKELAFSREIKEEQADLVFGSVVASGKRIRVGGLYALQIADSGPMAVMLTQLGEKKRIFGWQENLTPETKEQIKNALIKTDSVNVTYFPVDVLLSTALSSEMANYTEITWKDQVLKFFKDGGILMYPILALFLLGLLIALERLFCIVLKSRNGASAKVLKLLKEKNIESAAALQDKLKGSVGLILKEALKQKYNSREETEKALEEVFAREIPTLERGLSTISVAASTAPLLGLLGTVMGMIQLFEVITMHGTSDPKLLAGGISIALITTEAGLIAAIPLQLIHTFLSNRIDALQAKMEKAGLAVLNALWIKE